MISIFLTNVQLGDVNPLAVDVVVVDVLTAGGDALLAVVLAVVAGLGALAVIVLQTEGGLVPLHLPLSREIEYLKV